MLTHSHKNCCKGVEQLVYPLANFDFRRVTNGSSIELTIDGTRKIFVAGTDFAFDNNNLAITASNFKAALDNYLIANNQTANYTTDVNANIVSIASERGGDAYNLYPQVNNKTVIGYDDSKDAGTGTTVITHDLFTASKNGWALVAFYASGLPDLGILLKNGTQAAITSMKQEVNNELWTYLDDDYTTYTYKIQRTGDTQGYVDETHRRINDHRFVGNDKAIYNSSGNPTSQPGTNLNVISVYSRENEWKAASNIHDIVIAPTLSSGIHINCKAPQLLWTSTTVGDVIKLKAIGGTSQTGYTFKAYEIDIDSSNDIRITTDGAFSQQTITASEVEIIANQVFIQNLQNYAHLESGKVPASELPSYVDDVLEYANLAALPATGEQGKIYVTTDNNKTYRWSGSLYVEISPMEAHNHTLSSLTEKSYNSLTDKPTIPTVPTALSAFSKDINFDERYYTESEIDTKLSTKSDTTHNHTLASLSEKSYNSLTDKPTIPTVPTALSAFTKDINFDERYYTESEINNLLSSKQATITGAASTITSNNLNATSVVTTDTNGKITTTGVYAPLLGYLSGVSRNIQTQFNEISTYKADTTHNHTLSSLTEKSYNSLTDKPIIPTVPTALSAFTKDINFDERYYTESELNTLLNEKQNNLVSGTSLKTINNQSLLGSGNIAISGGGQAPIVEVITFFREGEFGTTTNFGSTRIALPAGQTKKIIAISAEQSVSGVVCDMTVCINGSNKPPIFSFSNSFSKLNLVTAINLTNDDKITLYVASVYGVPKDLAFNIYIETIFA